MLGRLMDEQNLSYRAAVLVGRTQAFNELAQLMARLGRNIRPDAPTHATLDACISNLVELTFWLGQSAGEAAEELQIVQAEIDRA